MLFNIENLKLYYELLFFGEQPIETSIINQSINQSINASDKESIFCQIHVQLSKFVKTIRASTANFSVYTMTLSQSVQQGRIRNISIR